MDSGRGMNKVVYSMATIVVGFYDKQVAKPVYIR